MMSPTCSDTIISLIDLTRLNAPDTKTDVVAFCKQAQTPLGPVAAVCVYPEYVAAVKQATGFRTATVANFPSGDNSIEQTIAEIKSSLNGGADEIDVVLPYKKLIASDVNFVTDFLTACRHATHGATLKVIIESGALSTEHITQASSLVAASGADFVKTSTGKIAQGASLEAAETILQTLATLNDPPGIKFSGGIRTKEQTQDYIKLVAQYMGTDWINPQHLRFGASQLLNALLAA